MQSDKKFEQLALRHARNSNSYHNMINVVPTILRSFLEISKQHGIKFLPSHVLKDWRAAKANEKKTDETENESATTTTTSGGKRKRDLQPAVHECTSNCSFFNHENLYLCKESGMLHFCDIRFCRMTEQSASAVICRLTGSVLGREFCMDPETEKMARCIDRARNSRHTGPIEKPFFSRLQWLSNLSGMIRGEEEVELEQQLDEMERAQTETPYSVFHSSFSPMKRQKSGLDTSLLPTTPLIGVGAGAGTAAAETHDTTVEEDEMRSAASAAEAVLLGIGSSNQGFRNHQDNRSKELAVFHEPLLEEAELGEEQGECEDLEDDPSFREEGGDGGAGGVDGYGGGGEESSRGSSYFHNFTLKSSDTNGNGVWDAKADLSSLKQDQGVDITSKQDLTVLFHSCDKRSGYGAARNKTQAGKPKKHPSDLSSPEDTPVPSPSLSSFLQGGLVVTPTPITVPEWSGTTCATFGWFASTLSSASSIRLAPATVFENWLLRHLTIRSLVEKKERKEYYDDYDNSNTNNNLDNFDDSDDPDFYDRDIARRIENRMHNYEGLRYNVSLDKEQVRVVIEFLRKRVLPMMEDLVDYRIQQGERFKHFLLACMNLERKNSNGVSHLFKPNSELHRSIQQVGDSSPRSTGSTSTSTSTSASAVNKVKKMKKEELNRTLHLNSDYWTTTPSMPSIVLYPFLRFDPLAKASYSASFDKTDSGVFYEPIGEARYGSVREDSHFQMLLWASRCCSALFDLLMVFGSVSDALQKSRKSLMDYTYYYHSLVFFNMLEQGYAIKVKKDWKMGASSTPCSSSSSSSLSSSPSTPSPSSHGDPTLSSLESKWVTVIDKVPFFERYFFPVSKNQRGVSARDASDHQNFFENIVKIIPVEILQSFHTFYFQNSFLSSPQPASKQNKNKKKNKIKDKNKNKN